VENLVISLANHRLDLWQTLLTKYTVYSLRGGQCDGCASCLVAMCVAVALSVETRPAGEELSFCSCIEVRLRTVDM
jgi:hypothetical protein